MNTCTFFGHRDTPDSIEPILISTIKNLIETQSVKIFYLGNNGNFDTLTRKILKNLATQYPPVKYYVVLAYPPYKKHNTYLDYSDTIYPQELVNVLPKYAIIKRNEWLINHSDYVISYVKYSTGGAKTFTDNALKKGKNVINIATLE